MPGQRTILKITGELDVDLRSNIAAEARAKIVYEQLINFCDDPGSKDALQMYTKRDNLQVNCLVNRPSCAVRAPPTLNEVFPGHRVVIRRPSATSTTVDNR
jgi:Mn-containing catalase